MVRLRGGSSLSLKCPFVCSDVFKYDDKYEENEEKYKEIRKTILDEENDDDETTSGSSASDDDDDDDKKQDADEEEQVVDEAESKNRFSVLPLPTRSLCRRKTTNDHRSNGD